ncbi:hypothetical protein [Streptomyces alboflavus]|uniref:hypothetical protein n=1 Tax=Streptomyces alboflavus TaxID=67267 RepID=UPI001F1AEE16|nr:hypothetical protein [Streptomyces alboflavus]
MTVPHSASCGTPTVPVAGSYRKNARQYLSYTGSISPACPTRDSWRWSLTPTMCQ